MMRTLLQLRSFIAAVLLILVAAPTVGLFVCQVQVCYNRFEILERLEEENLHSIRLPVSEVLWLDPGKELRIQDRLFDVKEYSTDGLVFTFTGIFDDEEDLLEKKISDHSVPGNNKIPHLLKLTGSPPIFAGTVLLLPFYPASKKPAGHHYVQSLACSAHDPASPPPRHSC